MCSSCRTRSTMKSRPSWTRSAMPRTRRSHSTSSARTCSSREPLDDAMRDLGMEEGFDVGFEMSGNATALRDMLRTMNHGGSISMLGIPPGETAIDWNQVIFKGLVIKGIYGREMFETWYKMSSMLQSGLNVRPVITHRLGINDYREGFEIMNSGKSGKVTLDWSSL